MEIAPRAKLDEVWRRGDKIEERTVKSRPHAVYIPRLNLVRTIRTRSPDNPDYPDYPDESPDKLAPPKDVQMCM